MTDKGESMSNENDDATKIISLAAVVEELERQKNRFELYAGALRMRALERLPDPMEEPKAQEVRESTEVLEAKASAWEGAAQDVRATITAIRANAEKSGAPR